MPKGRRTIRTKVLHKLTNPFLQADRLERGVHFEEVGGDVEDLDTVTFRDIGHSSDERSHYGIGIFDKNNHQVVRSHKGHETTKTNSYEKHEDYIEHVPLDDVMHMKKINPK